VPTGSKDKARVIPINVTVGEIHIAVGDEVYRYPLSGHVSKQIGTVTNVSLAVQNRTKLRHNGINIHQMPYISKTALNRQKPIKIRIKGGPGSGHYGHAGRPGKRGGSLPSGGLGGRLALGEPEIGDTFYISDPKYNIKAQVRVSDTNLVTGGQQWTLVEILEGKDKGVRAWYRSDEIKRYANITKPEPKPVELVPSDVANYEILNKMQTESIERLDFSGGKGVSKTYKGVLPDGTEVQVKVTSKYGNIKAEADTYQVAQMLGGEYADLVPPTVMRDDGSSVQVWQSEYSDAGAFRQMDYPHKINGLANNAEVYKKMVVMDTILGNTDRHIGNFMLRTE
ncbi:hypothetical protein LCGC14_1457170, partial [marine sediment metagenome]